MKSKLIFHIGHSAGFYSEFNNMVLAILYCKKHNIDFVIYSQDANFGQKNGWTDFFLPFCKETKWAGHHYINQRYDNPKGGKRKLLLDAYKFIHPNTYLTPDLWNSFRHIDQTEMTTQDVRDCSKQIVEETYRFNPKTQKDIQALMQTIHIDEPYIGFHIRGGDKRFETQLIDATEYIKKAETITSIRTVFVSSDDYNNVDILRKKFPEWRFYTLTDEQSKGYNQQTYNTTDRKEKRHQLLNMFASMEYLRNAELTFCTFSSNVGIFLGMCMGNQAIGVDFDDWRIW